MIEPRCQSCKEAGFPDVLAHYKSISAGQSRDGKSRPALCWDHYHGKIPRFVMSVQENSLEKLIEDTHKEISDRTNRGVPVLSNKEQDDEVNQSIAEIQKKDGRVKFSTLVRKQSMETFNGQNGEEPLAIDKDKVLLLRDQGKTWVEIAQQLGYSTHRVYQACRKLDPPRLKKKPKWEECLSEIANLRYGQSLVVKLPEGGTRAQMNSIIGINKLTQKWRWSLRDNNDGTVTATKGKPWENLVEARVPPDSYADNLEKIIAEIDMKIEKLQRAKEILSDPEIRSVINHD